MTAQIISFTEFAQARQLTAEERHDAALRAIQEDARQEYQAAVSQSRSRPARSRQMQLTDQARTVLARLNRGETITSLGWIEKPTQRMLDRLTKKGWLVEGIDRAFPKEKRCWIAALELNERAETGWVPSEFEFPA